ncbi:MAG: lactonase family protein [Acidobacteria bacterium]|nr:lactonase family protein [Acidobacteriota bacterium]
MAGDKPTRREFLGTGLAAALMLTGNGRAQTKGKSRTMLLYVGTYTSKTKSEGIYVFRFDAATGNLQRLHIAKDVADPSYLTVSNDRKHLFAVNELVEYDGQKSGAVSAFAIDPETGDLTFLNKQPSLGGAPCFITTSNDRKFALVANYVGGNISVFPIEKDGRLGASVALARHSGSGPRKDRQAAAHAHSINLDPANRYAFAADLGIDRLMIYAFDSQTGQLKPNDNQAYFQCKPGAGPRHFTFHPNGRLAFLINELDLSITSLSYDAERGTLKEIQTVPTLPANASTAGASCADIHVSPDGKFLYGSNRGHNSIVAYRVYQTTGKLEYLGHATAGIKKPRNFAIVPDGRFLLVANQESDSIVVFRRDLKTGKLTSTGISTSVPAPVCLKFIQATV